MTDFTNFLDVLRGNIKDYAVDNWKEHLGAVVSDGSAFLDGTREDMERWTKQLAKGELSKEDFRFLVLGKKDLMEMEALKQAGLALVRVDRCRKGLLDLVVNTALDAFM